jgi:hypothetical protein
MNAPQDRPGDAGTRTGFVYHGLAAGGHQGERNNHWRLKAMIVVPEKRQQPFVFGKAFP